MAVPVSTSAWVIEKEQAGTSADLIYLKASTHASSNLAIEGALSAGWNAEEF